ncbi:hypothetical protein [Chryseobacterium oryctis]|uniref:DUF4369 domain-containing protein n=1 Tax=Chryseobacterium oryctis TaxID=2952618 RepID=A0ABT3HJY0_9FLAO|nr:hypothetical protein [Chryseobacterium oryctis]MCW3160079.1 hypothetical protein [Chryseobacterium oryctis]
MKKNVYILILSFFILSCSKEKKGITIQNNESAITDTTLVNGVLLELSDSTGIGKLRIHSDEYKISGKIKIKPPCYFLKRDGKVLSFSYPEINVNETVIIQGKDGVQGIVFKKDSIIYEDYFPITSPYNVKEGADEIVYQDFAHRFYKNRY